MTCRLFLDTVFAACGCRVNQKPASVKFFLACKTLPVRTGLYPAQSTVDLLELTLAQPWAFLGQLLSLHVIPAG